MNTVSNTLQENESASTTKKAASMAHDAIDQAAEKAEPLEKKVRDQAHRAQDKFSATSAEASEQMHHQMEKAEAFIKQRPIAATGIAFAAGILAAIILRK